CRGDRRRTLADFVYSGGVDTSKWEAQDLGATRNMRSDFLRWRGARIDHYVIEMNKLLIRLEKLTAFDRASTDPARRKALEKSVVTWVNDRDVPCCPDCGVTFSIALRRHHCRLCGSIMCRRCTHFLTVLFAQKLTKAVRASVTAGGNSGGPDRGAGTLESGRRLSVSSVSSLLEEKDDDRIMTCQHCKGILEQRERRLEEKESSPVILQLYTKLHSCKASVDKLAPEYMKMADSLNAGESTYGLERASNLRVELMKLYERIDLLSKRIASLGVSEDPQPHPKTLQLQRMIRLSATQFLQEKLLGLTSLPTLEKFEELKARRAQREAELWKGNQVRDSGPSPQARPSQEAVIRDSGWLASSCSLAGQLDDPLLEQIANIQSFLAQARQAGRSSEARTLEENLRQLEEEWEIREEQEAGRREAPAAQPNPAVNGAVPRPSGLNPFEGPDQAANPFEEEEERGADGQVFSNPFEEGELPSGGLNPFECEEEEEAIEEELLQQQIDNIKAYVFDAKQAGRMDEVASLLDNLTELRRALEATRSRHQAL
ncbi:rabenosyn-5, partial [Mustelus asterias]